MKIFHIWVQKRQAIVGVSLLSALAVWLVAWLGFGQYSSHAMLSTGIVEEVIRTAQPQDSLAPTRRYVDDRFSHMISLMTSEQAMQLLAYRLILHDMNMPEPFQQVSPLRSRYGDAIWNDARGYYKALLDSAILPRTTDDIVFLRLQTELGSDPASLASRLEITRVPGTQFIRVRCYSSQPHFSAFVVNALCQEFIRYHNLMEAAKSRTSVTQLEKLAARKRKELDEQMQRLHNYKRSPKHSQPVGRRLVHHVKKYQRNGESDPELDTLVQDVAQALEAYLSVLNKLNAASFVSMNPGSQIRQVEYGIPAAYPGLFPGILFGFLAGVIAFGASLWYGYWQLSV